MKKLILLCALVSLGLPARTTNRWMEDSERGGGRDGREFGNGRGGTIVDIYVNLAMRLDKAKGSRRGRNTSAADELLSDHMEIRTGSEADTQKILDFVLRGGVRAVSCLSGKVGPDSDSAIKNGRLYVNSDLFAELILNNPRGDVRMIEQLLAATHQVDNGAAELLAERLHKTAPPHKIFD